MDYKLILIYILTIKEVLNSHACIFVINSILVNNTFTLLII